MVNKLTNAMDKIRLIAELLPDDDPDKIEMMNIEGDYEALMEWAMNKRNEMVFMADGCKSLAATYTERKVRFEKKADNLKEICRVLLNCAKETKYIGSSGTCSIRQNPDKLIIRDETRLPEEYLRIKKEADKKAIKAALDDGIEIEGVTTEKGTEGVTIRLK